MESSGGAASSTRDSPKSPPSIYSLPPMVRTRCPLLKYRQTLDNATTLLLSIFPHPRRCLQQPPSLLVAYLCDGVPPVGWSDSVVSYSFVLSQPFNLLHPLFVTTHICPPVTASLQIRCWPWKQGWPFEAPRSAEEMLQFLELQSPQLPPPAIDLDVLRLWSLRVKIFSSPTRQATTSTGRS